MMDITIREMRKDEAALALQTGRASFGLFEGLAFQKPKQAFLAILDDQIVGMASYQIFSAKNNQKIGYLETGYVKKGCEGKGIGSKLYEKVTVYLKEQGCVTVTGTVKDDNVASWKLFENNGYHTVGFLQMLQSYGLISTIGLWFKSTLAFATGFHLWSTMPQKISPSACEISVFAFLNLLVLLPVLLLGRSWAEFGMHVGAILLLLTASLAGGFIAALCSRERWCFRVTRGGLLISVLLAALGGIWPIVGRFYPLEYKRTAVFRRDMALEGLFEWLALLLLIGTAAVFKNQSVFWSSVFSLGTTLLLFHSLPVYPFECFGGGRIWRYSKGLCALTIAVSVALAFFW